MTSLTGKPIESFGRMISASKEALGLSKPPPELVKEREWLWRQVKDEGIVRCTTRVIPRTMGWRPCNRRWGEGSRKPRASSWARAKGRQSEGDVDVPADGEVQQ